MSPSEKFSWNDESVVVRTQPAVAVYLNPHDEVVIRQEGQFDDDAWIYLTRENALKVARAILRECGLNLRIPERETFPDDEPKDKTAAERAKRYREKKRHGVTERDASVTQPRLELVNQ